MLKVRREQDGFSAQLVDGGLGEDGERGAQRGDVYRRWVRELPACGSRGRSEFYGVFSWETAIL
jgi:hypothetical protein